MHDKGLVGQHLHFGNVLSLTDDNSTLNSHQLGPSWAATLGATQASLRLSHQILNFNTSDA